MPGVFEMDYMGHMQHEQKQSCMKFNKLEIIGTIGIAVIQNYHQWQMWIQIKTKLCLRQNTQHENENYKPWFQYT